MRIQGEAFYALKVPSKNTEKLFDEITSLATASENYRYQMAIISQMTMDFSFLCRFFPSITVKTFTDLIVYE
jgi:hypothetical protein